MLSRRCLLYAGLLPLTAGASGLADVLVRPAAPMRLSSKPSMVRIVRAGDRLVAVGERGIVLLSDDDGQHWRQARVPVSTSLTGVQFLDTQQGWAIGHAAVVLQTTDGGETWALRLDGTQVVAAMQARAQELADTVPASDPAVQRVRELARQALADGPDKPLLDLHFSNERQGWVVGAYGLALQTNDGGRSWQARGDVLPNPKGLHLYAVVRQGAQLFMAGEQGLFMRVSLGTSSTTPTDLRVDSASALPTPYRGSFFALTALPEGGLLFGGLRGTLLLRSSAGEFRSLDSGTPQAIVSIAPWPARGEALTTGQRLALVDQSGRVLLGSASTGRFTLQPPEAERRWVAVAMARDGALVGAGTTGVGRLAMPASVTP